MQVVIKSRRTVVRGRIYHHITAIEGDLLRTGNLPLDYVETDGYWIVSESTGEPRTRAVLIRQGNEHIASIVPGIDIESGRFEELCDIIRVSLARLKGCLDNADARQKDVDESPSDVRIFSA